VPGRSILIPGSLRNLVKASLNSAFGDGTGFSPGLFPGGLRGFRAGDSAGETELNYTGGARRCASMQCVRTPGGPGPDVMANDSVPCG